MFRTAFRILRARENLRVPVAVFAVIDRGFA
jgi:hypothetical protein